MVIKVLLYWIPEIGPMVSDRLRIRLVRREAVLVLIDRRRAETGNPNLACALEKKLLDLELADLASATAAQESLEHSSRD